MKIKKIIASGFGCLSGSYTFFHDRTNLIVEDNERGKSTLVAAILAGLYGFPRSGERKKLGDRGAYKPWSGGSYGVGLEVEDDEGRVLLIQRDFTEPSGPDGKLKVLDLSTNRDVTQVSRAGKRDFAIGERFLGISREIFIKTCLVRQLEIDNLGESREDLVDKVQQIFATPGGKGTAAGAMAILREEMRKERVGLGQRRISELDEAIAQTEALMRRLTEEREKAAPTMARLRDLRKEMETLEILRQQLEYLARRAQMAEIESALKEDASNRSALQKMIQRRESLKLYSDFRKEQAGEFQRLAGRIGALDKQKKDFGMSLETLKSELDTRRSRLKDFEGFEALGEDFKTRLHDLRMAMKRLSEEVESRRKELSRFEESLEKEGCDLSEIEGLSRRFSNVSVEDNDSLRRSEARIPEIKAEVIQLETGEEKCREELQAVKRPRKVLLPVGGVLCLVGTVIAFLSTLGIGAAIVAAGAATLGFALFLFPRLTMYRIQKCIGEEAGARERRESLLSERDEITEKLREAARKVGFETVAELSEAFKRWGRLEGRARRLESLRMEAGEAENQRAAARGTSSDELKKMGLDVPRVEVNVTLLEKAEKRVGDYLETVSSIKQLEEGRRKLEAEIAEIDGERKAVDESLRKILSAAKLPANLPTEQALPKVEDARRKSEESHRLSTVEIPEMERRLFPGGKVDDIKQKLESLTMETEMMATEEPELRGIQPAKTYSEYAQEARGVLDKIGKIRDERNKLFQNVQDVENRYHQEYPRLANKATELREAIDGTQRFRDSMLLAVETLEKISAESHARWADVLNERTNEILRHLNPRCRELKFDRDLSFTVVPAKGEEPKDQRHIEAQQSVGARHQIYLAVRLALADYLSSEVRMPVILDDPFATSDDERFLSGMRFLCREFRKKRQLIILTCHRRRHTDFIREQAPELLDEIRYVELSRKEG